MLNLVLVFGNCASGSVTRRQRNQIDKQNHGLTQPFASGSAIKRSAEQFLDVDRPKRDRNEQPLVEFWR